MYRNQTHVQSQSHQSPARNRQPYLVRHDFDGSAELTTTLAHALSSVSGVDVTQTEFTLYDYVDPDALDRLFTPREDANRPVNGRLTFTVWGHEVTVYSDGQIAIVPPRQPPRTTQSG